MKFNIHLIYANSRRDFALEEDIFKYFDYSNLHIEDVETTNALAKSLSEALNDSDVILTIGDKNTTEKIRKIVKVNSDAKSRAYNFKDDQNETCAHAICANGQSIISITSLDPHFVFNQSVAKFICKKYNLPLPATLEEEKIDDYNQDENDKTQIFTKRTLALSFRLAIIFLMVAAIGLSGFFLYDGLNRDSEPVGILNINTHRPYQLVWAQDDDLAVIEHFGTWNHEGDITATIDVDYNSFLSLSLGDTVLTLEEDYKVASGSTNITLFESFLENLSVGTYTFVAEFIGEKTVNITLVIADITESHHQSVVDEALSSASDTSIAEITSIAPAPQSETPPTTTQPPLPLPPSSAVTPPATASAVSIVPSIPPQSPTSTAPAGATRIRIRNELAGNAVVEGDAITLVAWVLEAEMGSHWPLEALRAQAVAAYSWLWFNGARDFNRTPPQLPMRSPGARARQAAADTYGTLVLHNGRVAETMFFAMSAGVTTSSQYVWTANRPYLQSVQASHENANTINNFQTTRTIPAATLANAVREFTSASANHDELNLTTVANRQNWLHVVYCPTGTYVRHIYFGSARGARNRVNGNTLRQNVLTPARVGAGNSLRSHAFTVTYNASNDTFTFTVRGFGHGVGMSQEGARVLANQGQNHRQILQHYFRGITFGSK